MSAKIELWALLIGIDAYASPSVSGLHGCENDVRAVALFLRESMDVPESRIRLIVNETATRARILREFQDFLIDNESIAPGAQILIHYSGHGAQMRNLTGTEPDGRDETLVPYDSRQSDVFDISDKTLVALIDKVAQKRGDNITVVLDCCHSGSGTRVVRSDITAVTRRAPFDERMPPPGLDADLRKGLDTRGVGRSGWARAAANHVLIAACLDREEAREYQAENGIYGALTFFLLSFLRQRAEGATYADLHDFVRGEIGLLYPDQTPQCEGQRQRLIFGGMQIAVSPFIPARVDGNSVHLEAGQVHGLARGCQLAIYPSTETGAGDLPTPLATARITAVGPTSSRAQLDKMPAEPLPKVVRAKLTARTIESPMLRVSLIAESVNMNSAISVLRDAIANAQGPGSPSPYLELVDDGTHPAQVQVLLGPNGCQIRDAEGKLLVVPEQLDGRNPEKVRLALESIARFRIIAALDNPAISRLTGQVSMRLRHYRPGAAPAEMDVVGMSEEGSLTLEYDPDDSNKNKYVVEVINKTGQSLYPSILILNPDYSIYGLYPALGQSEELRPGGTLFVLPASGGDLLQVGLLGDELGEERWDLSHDQLKLIATTRPPNCNITDFLCQHALRVPAQRGAVERRGGSALARLLEAIAAGKATRMSRPERASIGEDWTTASLPYVVVRRACQLELASAKAVVSLGDGITLEKPEGFVGSISIAPLEQSRRGLSEGELLKFPPGFERLQHVFTPLARVGARDSDGEPLVIALEADERSRQQVNGRSPLRLRLPETGDDFLAVAFDGEDFLPVGFGAGANTLDLVTLPALVATTGEEAGKRGLGRPLKLFVFKKLGRAARETGLRRVVLDEERFRYTAVNKEQFAPGHRVALLVHGFLSDTEWLGRDVAPFLRREIIAYDHVLTWDYETFGTSVESNGAELAAALRQKCGLDAADGMTLDVYAHGMGALVARCMVEISGGYEFVNHMILAGPPNRGTALATVSRGMVYLLATFLNGISQLPLAGAASWAIKALYETGHGWKDLETDSELTRRINALVELHQVPYLVLAGTHVEGQGARLTRLADKLLDRGLDAVLGESDHDGIVPMSSMRGVRNGTYPTLRVEALPCDHFGYFSASAGRAAIGRWLRN